MMRTEFSWVRSLLVRATIFAILATSGVMAQAQAPVSGEEELIEVGLTFLPQPTSVEYATLRQVADAVSQAPLQLSNGEIWKIKRTNLEPLRALAKKVGTTVIAFGAAIPSETHRKGAEHKLDAVQQQLVSAIGDMASAVELKIVQATHFEALEYTEATQPTSRKEVRRLRLALESGVEIVATRVGVDVRDDAIVWRGIMDQTNEPFDIFLGRGGMVTGMLKHGRFKYWIRPLGHGLLAVVKIDESRLPADHGVSDVSLLRRIEQLARGGSAEKQSRVLHFKDILGESSSGAVTPERPAAIGRGPVEIDVMVVYTAKAARNYADIGLELIRPAIESTNDSFKNSGIDDVTVRLVHTHKTDYDEADAEHFDHVWRMVDRGDGYMEEVPELREKYKADVVILITDSRKGCGLATRVAPEAEEAYAVVHHECAGITYSIAHELGHVLGARHDRVVDKAATATSYSHGYVDPQKQWRSMMAYKEGCDGCARLPVWSTPTKSIGGRPAGDEQQDNARAIREQAARVSGFR